MPTLLCARKAYSLPPKRKAARAEIGVVPESKPKQTPSPWRFGMTAKNARHQEFIGRGQNLPVEDPPLFALSFRGAMRRGLPAAGRNLLCLPPSRIFIF